MTDRSAASESATGGGTAEASTATSETSPSAEPSSPTATLAAVAAHIRSHPLLTATGAVIAFLAALTGLIVNGWDILDRLDGREAPATAPSTVADPVADAEEATGSSPASTAPTVGTCLDDSGTVVPCGRPHRYEVVAAGRDRCDDDDVVRHLGGRPDTDVVLDDLAAVPLDVGSATACAVGRASGDALRGDLADALTRTEHGTWRWCVDTRTARDVACTQDHDVEYVGVDDGDGVDAATCHDAAERYLEASFDRFADSLQISVEPTTDDSTRRPPCLLATRGSTVLTDTVRGIGARALPLTSP